MTNTMFPHGMTRRGMLKSGMALTAVGLIVPAGMATERVNDFETVAFGL